MNVMDAYLRNSLRHSYLLPTSVALLFAAFGLSSFLMLLPATQSKDASVLVNLLDQLVKAESDEYLALNFSQAHISASLVFVACIAVAAVIFKYDRSDRHAFMLAYPHLDLMLPDALRSGDHREAKCCKIVGSIAAVLAISGFIVLTILNLKHEASGVGFCLAAVSVWCFMHGSLLMRRYDMFVYNFSALKRTSIYSLNTDQLGSDGKAVIEAKRDSLKSQSINRVVLTIAALVSFALYFLPTLYTPLYWVPLAVAAIIMAAVAHRELENARKVISNTSAHKDDDHSSAH